MITKEYLEEVIEKGFTIEKISIEVNLSKTGTKYWIKKYGLKTKGHRRDKKWSECVLLEKVSISETKSEVLKRLGLNINAGNFNTLDRYIKKYSIDISHFDRHVHKNRFNSRKYSDKEVYIKDSNYSNNTALKKRIIRSELKIYQCDKCLNKGVWEKQKLELQLDHINGDNRDNRLENLRFLCPNCHSQTSTFCAKNKKRKSGVAGAHDCLKNNR